MSKRFQYSPTEQGFRRLAKSVGFRTAQKVSCGGCGAPLTHPYSVVPAKGRNEPVCSRACAIRVGAIVR